MELSGKPFLVFDSGSLKWALEIDSPPRRWISHENRPTLLIGNKRPSASSTEDRAAIRAGLH